MDSFFISLWFVFKLGWEVTLKGRGAEAANWISVNPIIAAPSLQLLALLALTDRCLWFCHCCFLLGKLMGLPSVYRDLPNLKFLSWKLVITTRLLSLLAPYHEMFISCGKNTRYTVSFVSVPIFVNTLYLGIHIFLEGTQHSLRKSHNLNIE